MPPRNGNRDTAVVRRRSASPFKASIAPAKRSSEPTSERFGTGIRIIGPPVNVGSSRPLILVGQPRRPATLQRGDHSSPMEGAHAAQRGLPRAACRTRRTTPAGPVVGDLADWLHLDTRPTGPASLPVVDDAVDRGLRLPQFIRPRWRGSRPLERCLQDATRPLRWPSERATRRRTRTLSPVAHRIGQGSSHRQGICDKRAPERLPASAPTSDPDDCVEQANEEVAIHVYRHYDMRRAVKRPRRLPPNEQEERAG